MSLSKDLKNFRCKNKECRKTISVRKDTIFYGKHLECSQVLFLSYLWLAKIGTSAAMTMSGFSPNTVVSYYKQFREAMENTLELDDTFIGGEGTIVQIDECKMGKRKYNRGHAVKGAWILWGVGDSPEKKVFLLEVPNRNSETLTQLIRKHVRPGSIVITDCWKGYNRLKDFYDHFSVNHSENYVDPNTGATTNNIEGVWN